VGGSKQQKLQGGERSKGGASDPCSSYEALLRENERVRDSLADAHEENDYLRQFYRSLPSRAGRERRNVV
jgi:hypothetical protein